MLTYFLMATETPVMAKVVDVSGMSSMTPRDQLMFKIGAHTQNIMDLEKKRGAESDRTDLVEIGRSSVTVSQGNWASYSISCEFSSVSNPEAIQVSLNRRANLKDVNLGSWTHKKGTTYVTAEYTPGIGFMDGCVQNIMAELICKAPYNVSPQGLQVIQQIEGELMAKVEELTQFQAQLSAMGLDSSSLLSLAPTKPVPELPHAMDGVGDDFVEVGSDNSEEK
ncbi:MAG: hypothetical protein H6850_02765 [Alphaproteobacteria bacterium]|nr:MAG: hypothetical protein H6850_02765 [Alphaproteobacteria bacterium]